MADDVFVLDSVLLKQILVDFILPLVSVYITTYLAIKSKQKYNQFEKNQYLKTLKRNACIKKAFHKLSNVNDHKYQSLLVFIMWVGVGFMYFFVALAVLNILIPIITICLALLFQSLQIEAITIEDIPLIYGVSFHLSIIPLIIFILTLAYSINCKNKTNIIQPILIKRQVFGKRIQILRCKLWSIGKKSNPIFTNEMNLTQKSVEFFHLFSLLLGIVLTVNFFIYFVIFSILLYVNEEPFSFSLKDLPSVYLKGISISGSWDSFIISISLLSLVLVVYSCLWLYLRALYFIEDSKNEIIKFYSKGYPFILIKTSSGTLEGKIEDIFNKHFILLNHEGTQKITSWNNVGIIEMKMDDK